jgi:hypothetical protein
MVTQDSEPDPWSGHRWWFKLKALLITGALAYPLSRLMGFSFSFAWYVLAMGFCLLIGFGWAAVELWKDFGRSTRN